MGHQEDELLDDLLGLLVEDYLHEQMREGGRKLLHVVLVHLHNLLLQLCGGLGFGDIGLLPQQGDQPVDVGVVVLDDLCGGRKTSLLLSGAGLAL